MKSTYKAPAYDENKYRKGIDTSFYSNAVQNYTNDAEQNRARQIADAQKNQQTNLRQAYINRLQNEQKLNQNLAQQGIRGGMTQTANLRLANQYGAERSAAQSDYNNAVNTINQNIDKNITDYRNDMESRAEQYAQTLAQAKWQADREDTNNEIARQTEYWSNYYTNLYSGYSKKDAKKAIEKLKKKLKKTSDPMKKIRLQQAISGASARLGVIKNK